MIDYLMMGALTYLCIFLWILRRNEDIPCVEYEVILIVLLWPLMWLFLIGIVLSTLFDWLQAKHLKAKESS